MPIRNQNRKTTARIITGDARLKLKEIDDQHYQSCITSPPYYQLRDYEHPDQIGQENSVEEYLAALIRIFKEVWRVLKDDGTCWVNLSDSFEDKNLLCIPFRFALKMKEKGWILGQEIIWSKPDVPPESTSDRRVRSHEYFFMFTKQKKYQFYKDRLREKGTSSTFGTPPKKRRKNELVQHGKEGLGEARLKMREEYARQGYITRDKRSVWEVGTSRTNNNFATYPVELIEPIILASSKVGDLILDPFGGSGTTALSAILHDRSCDLIELNEEYAAIYSTA